MNHKGVRLGHVDHARRISRERLDDDEDTD